MPFTPKLVERLRPPFPSPFRDAKRYQAHNAAARGIGSNAGGAWPPAISEYAQRSPGFLDPAGICLWLNQDSNTTGN